MAGQSISNTINGLKPWKRLDIDGDFYALRTRELDEILPWRLYRPLVSKNYLIREYKKIIRGTNY